MSYYIINDIEEKMYREMIKNRNTSIIALNKLSELAKYSPVLHVVLVDNLLYSNNKKNSNGTGSRVSSLNLIKKLVGDYKQHHILVVIYGETVRFLSNITEINENTYKNVKYALFEDYDINRNYDKNQIMNAIKNRHKIGDVDFICVARYEDVICYT